MRPVLGSVFALSIVVSGCAGITGLSDYDLGQAADASSSPLTVPDASSGDTQVVVTSDGPTAIDNDAAGPLPDAETLDAMSDVQFDAPPACGPGNCGGCCDSNGECVGGLSVGTCGAGGQSCADCMTSGKSCHAGVCVVDAGAPPPACVQAKCTNACIPFYQMACCKSDNTCGCEVSFSGSCK